jgi:phosphoribosyl-AMP cyclohydrolase
MSDFIDSLRFDHQGLIPAIAQQHDSGEVLMLAWMNRQAINQTIASGQVWYWSRSRGALWRKGQTSGQIQRLVELRVDCDQDALLVKVDQTGVACHTGRRSCFFNRVENGRIIAVEPIMTDPAVLYR